MTDKIGFFITAIIYIAILYVLVRPNSKGAQAVANISSTLSDLVRGVMGQTYNPGTNKWSTGNG